MVQLRQDYERFTERDAVILVVGPDDQKAFQNYWGKENFPFIGLPDPKHEVARLRDGTCRLVGPAAPSEAPFLLSTFRSFAFSWSLQQGRRHRLPC